MTSITSIEIVKALVECGWEASRVSPKPAVRELTVQKRAVTVAIKAVTADDPKYQSGARYQVMLRIDHDLAASLQQLGEDGGDLDRWIAVQEGALNAIVRTQDDIQAPFSGMALRHQQLLPDDPIAAHLVRKGRYRDSMWLVVKS